MALLYGSPREPGLDPWRYLALCLTSAAGVAVLGARRSQMAAWDFVVLGLLAVMLLPLGENLVLGTPAMDTLRTIFLGTTLAVAILNYVPTAVAMAALLLGGTCIGEGLALFATGLDIGPTTLDILHVCLLMVPWLGLALWLRPRRETLVIDQLWRDFRDRFGLLWGQRVRQQYNRSAAHAGLPGLLSWQGWEPGEKEPLPTVEQFQEMQTMLEALFKPFGAKAS